MLSRAKIYSQSQLGYYWRLNWPRMLLMSLHLKHIKCCSTLYAGAFQRNWTKC